MEQVTTLFPPAFSRTLALAHFMALLSRVGLLLLVGYAVRYRLRGGVGLCLLGIARREMGSIFCWW